MPTFYEVLYPILVRSYPVCCTVLHVNIEYKCEFIFTLKVYINYVTGEQIIFFIDYQWNSKYNVIQSFIVHFQNILKTLVTLQ